MRITLFDPVAHGHHPSWARVLGHGLGPGADVTLCVPERLVPLAAGGATTVIPVPEDLDPEAELDLLGDLIADTRPDHVLHLYAVKATLRAWLRRAPFPVPCAVTIIHPAALHYPARYGSSLTASEWANALYKELLVARWRRRPDAQALLVMDEAAVDRWNRRRRGARAFYLPEPPVAVSPPAGPPRPRAGILMYGALRAGKGVDRLGAALGAEPTDVPVRLAGSVEPDYAPTVRRAVATMRAAGVDVTVEDRFLALESVMDALSSARVLAMPYLRQRGNSRTLLEAAAAGTPVVAHDRGLMAHLVRRHGLGLVVDCTDARAFRRALLALAEDASAPARYSDALAAFTALHDEQHFRARLGAPFGLDDSAAPAIT